MRGCSGFVSLQHRAQTPTCRVCSLFSLPCPTNRNQPQQVYKQKVKHLLYEHQNNITTLKSDGELALKLQQDEYRKREGDLGKDKRNLKLELKEQVGARRLVLAAGLGGLRAGQQDVGACVWGRGSRPGDGWTLDRD